MSRRDQPLPPAAGVATAVVTGASSGIGAAFARALAARGHPLVLVARSEDGLTALAGELGAHRVPVRVVVADLATVEGLARAEEAMATADPPLGLLVANAATGAFGPLATQSAADLDAAVLVNVLAPTRLMAAALRAMPDGGGIVVMSSIAAGVADPDLGVYAAGKAYLETLARATRAEVRRARGRVRVTTVRPGWTRTGFHDRVGQDTAGVPDAQWQDADTVARAALAAHAAGRAVVDVVPPDPRPLAVRTAGRAYHSVRSRIATLRSR